jgi:hypothetical protein
VRRPALVAVSVVVTVVFGYLAVRGVHPALAWEALKSAQVGWLVPSFALLGVGMFMRAVRWHTLFAPETRPPLRAVIGALLVGQLFNNVLPLRAGEPARIVALNRRAGVPIAEALGTSAVERVFDVLSLLMLLFAVSPFLPAVTWLRAAAVFAAAIAAGTLIVVAVLAVYGDRPLAFVARLATRLPHLPAETLERAGANLAHGLAGLRRLRLGVVGFAWTTAAWIVISLSFWCVLEAFDLGLSPVAGVLVLAATGLALILPAGPSSVGVFEAAVVVALRAYDVPESEALPCAIVLHAVNFVAAVVPGIPAVHWARLKVRPTLTPENARAISGKGR